LNGWLTPEVARLILAVIGAFVVSAANEKYIRYETLETKRKRVKVEKSLEAVAPGGFSTRKTARHRETASSHARAKGLIPLLGQSRGDADGQGRRRQSRGGVGAIASQRWLAIFPAGSRHSPITRPSFQLFLEELWLMKIMISELANFDLCIVQIKLVHISIRQSDHGLLLMRFTDN